MKAVENDLSGIGYTGVGYLMADNEKPKGNVWAMPVYIEGQKAYSPYEIKSVHSGEYPVTRPLYQYINSAHSEMITNFILFELSVEGQQMVRRFGYFPINDYQKEINRVKGLVLN